MKVKVGTDIVNITRFKRKLAKNSLDLSKIYLENELDGHDPTHIAGIFAAKEAVIKALNLKPGDWLKIQITSSQNGKPQVKLPQNLENRIQSLDLSISTEKDLAIATLVAILK